MKSRKNIKNLFSTIGDKHLKFIKQVPYRTHDRPAQNQKKIMMMMLIFLLNKSHNIHVIG